MTPTSSLMAFPLSHSPEIWAFAVTNVLTFILGASLAVIAYLAYRREGLQTLLIVSIGFALITVGTITEMAYEIGFHDSSSVGFSVFGQELLLLRTIEGAFIGLGLLLLVYSLIRA